MTAKEIIRMEYGDSTNFMTPNVIEYGMVDDVTAYEISMGYGLYNDRIYGVSIVDYDPKTGETERRTDLSKCVSSLEKAQRYISTLKIDDDF